MERLKKILGGIVIVIMFLTLVCVSLDIFFNINLQDYLKEKVVFTEQDIENITIIEPAEMISFDPTLFDSFTRQRLNNFYEALVRPDSNLNIQPSLAVSWGLINDTTWEFRIRSGVKFHNGSALTINDVIASFDMARNAESSQLKDLLSTIVSVEKIDEKTLKITTSKPDPLLLQRVSTVYIVPQDFDVKNPIGSGPYQLSASKITLQDLRLSRFDGYWGKMPKFKQVNFVTITDGASRLNVFLRGGADILNYVPYDLAGNIDTEMYDLTQVPSLEVQFLLFNFNGKIFKDAEIRKAVKNSLDERSFAKFLGNYVHGVSQFISKGIFGYSSDIESKDNRHGDEIFLEVKDLIDKKKVTNPKEFNNAKISVLLPYGLDTLGEFISTSFEKVGLTASIQYVRSEYYEDTLKKVKPDLYFMAFKSELGDGSDFLNSVVRTGAQYNFSGYSSKVLDDLVAKESVAMDEEKRLDLLKEAMTVVTENDVIGVPLFEYDLLFASKKDLDFEPRIDGFIYLQDL